MNKQIQPITLDLIQQMRLNGKRKEAMNLLTAYHQSNKKQRIQDKKELKNIDRQIKKHYNICTSECCENETTSEYQKCEACRLQSKEYKIKRKNYLLSKTKL